MGEYALGKRRTRVKRQSSVSVNVTVKRAVYDRLCRMRDALQRELGPAHHVTIASVVRRVLYLHPAFKQISHRHYPLTEETGTGDDLVM